MSTIWDVAGVDIDARFLGTLEPAEVLIDVDGARLYVARTPVGDVLVYQCAEESNRLDWLVVPINTSTIGRLRRGEVALSEALASEPMWLVEQALDGTVRVVRRVEHHDVPQRFLPAVGVNLLGIAKVD